MEKNIQIPNITKMPDAVDLKEQIEVSGDNTAGEHFQTNTKNEQTEVENTVFEFVVEDDIEHQKEFDIISVKTNNYESDIEYEQNSSENLYTGAEDDTKDTSETQQFSDDIINSDESDFSEVLSQLKLSFPQLKEVNTVKDLPNFDKIDRYIKLGLTATEAYAAANIKEINAFYARKNAQIQEKSHLKSSVPRGVSTQTIYISAQELKTWRETFPNMTDAEISALYKQTM